MNTSLHRRRSLCRFSGGQIFFTRPRSLSAKIGKKRWNSDTVLFKQAYCLIKLRLRKLFDKERYAQNCLINAPFHFSPIE